MLPVPVLTPRLSSYWVDVITDVSAALARPLIEGLRSEMIVRSDAATRRFGPPETGFEQALKVAENARVSRYEAPFFWLTRLPRHLGEFAGRRLLPPVLSARFRQSPCPENPGRRPERTLERREPSPLERLFKNRCRNC